jgi:hypothetical protein
MANPAVYPPPNLFARSLPSAIWQTKEGASGTTPKAKLVFNLEREQNPPTQTHQAGSNTFIIMGKENKTTNFFKKVQEDPKEGWSFQGRKKHAVRIASPRQEAA